MKILELGNPAGETLLMLHGGNVAGWMWGQQAPAFTDYRMLVPDLPGFGASNDETWNSTAATADALADTLDGPAHVVGLSLGASVGLQLAARHPHLVRTLFVASAQVTPPRRLDVLAGRVTLLAWNQRQFWTATVKAYGLEGADAEQFVDTGLGIDRATALAVFDEVRMGVPREVLEMVTAPTLSVAGGADSAAIAGASLVALGAGIRGSVVGTAPGLHHQWNIENVELFNATLRCWLDERRLYEGVTPAGGVPVRR